MTTTTDRAVPARPRKKSEGQWAKGYREPLNQNERTKKDDDALNVRARIENIYAKQGFDSIDGGDLRGRFRWWGLYTQRAEGLDATFTGMDDEEQLDARYFMLRIRTDGARLSTEQLRVIAGISTEFARDTADLTDRENVQLHWVRIEDVPEIWRRLEQVGLKTTEACGDCPRAFLGSPLAGVAADEVIDATPAIEETVRRYVGDPRFSNLPRKFKTAISGLQDVAHEVNDVSFVGVNHPEHGPGFDLWVGGGLSTNPMVAQRLGAWVPIDEVPDVWEGVVSVFRDYGYRRLRSRARIKFLIKDWGAAEFRRVLEEEYLKRPLLDGPAPAPQVGIRDHMGVQRQRDGRNAVGVAPVAGRVSGTKLAAVADAMDRAGTNRVCITAYQKLVFLDVADDTLETFVADLDALELPARGSSWRRNVMACSGLEFCKLAFTETRVRAQTLVPDLEQRLADLEHELDTQVTVNINGCPNSCARVQVADIGFKGILLTDDDGQPVDGFQVHLGGGLGADAGFGKKLRGHKITTHELGEYVERVVRSYAKQREHGERFAQWVTRAEESDLR
ncbi:nitrite/sulfite reductase [Rhodococcus sp. X156]|uniref:nitrite/sulfite reductase n=1 Tax=Rhodococcus sp. X156 TaxID=2499145 RepID=UPI000FDCD2DB|nr:nitrite/sulfite reductase [Rhodococcus sp. X156]